MVSTHAAVSSSCSIYMRGVAEGASTIEGMRPGDYTLCALLGPDKFKCTQTRLTAAATQAASIVTPE